MSGYGPGAEPTVQEEMKYNVMTEVRIQHGGQVQGMTAPGVDQDRRAVTTLAITAVVQ